MHMVSGLHDEGLAQDTWPLFPLTCPNVNAIGWFLKDDGGMDPPYIAILYTWIP